MPFAFFDLDRDSRDNLIRLFNAVWELDLKDS